MTCLRAIRRTRAILLACALAAWSATAGAAGASGATIQGTVTDAADGEPLSGVTVEARFAGDIGANLMGGAKPKATRARQGQPILQLTTDDAGHYEITGLEPGPYHLFFDAPPTHADEYHHDAQTAAEATKVILTAPADVETVDEDLAPGLTISGAVVDAEGDEVEGICVRARRVDGGVASGDAKTAADGAYEIGGLAAGEHKVQFDPCDSDTGLAMEWWDDKPTEADADPVEAPAAPINASLSGGGAITGHVKDSAGSAAEGARVTVLRDGNEVVTATTDQFGDFAVPHLAPFDAYKVRFTPPPGSKDEVEYWEDASTLEAADDVAVTEGGTTGPLNAQLDKDETPPVVEITDGPDALTNDRTPTFLFTVDETAVDVDCRMDGGPFEPCSDAEAGEHTAGPLGDGFHTFTVQARDAADNAGEDSWSFTVDATGPHLEIVSGPTGPTTDTRPAFSYTVGGDATSVECSIAPPGQPRFDDCMGELTVRPPAPLALGAYEFRVRATDELENVSVAVRPFAVVGPALPKDTTPPTVKITSGPLGKIRNRRPRFGFTSDDPTARFFCSLDGKPEKPCTSPTRTKKLKNGKHTFTVSAVDQAGNRGADTRKFKVKKKKKKKKKRKRRRR